MIMKNRLKIKLLLMLEALICIIIFCCTHNNSGTKAGTSIPKKVSVSILQLGTHDVIDKVVEGVRSRLLELYDENKIEIRVYNANFDSSSLALLARQITASDADVVCTVTTPASEGFIGINRGVKPLVFTFVTDPSALGYKGPGTIKNTTGLSDEVDYQGELRLIKKLMPRAKTIGYLLTQSEANARIIHQRFQEEALGFGLEIITGTVAQATDVRMVAQSLANRVQCFLFGGDNTVASNISSLIDVARSYKIPVFANDEESVDAGAIAGISVDYYQMGRRTGEFISFVLSGAKIDSIPIEIFKAKKLVVNLAVAKQLSIPMPSSLVEEADKKIQ